MSAQVTEQTFSTLVKRIESDWLRPYFGAVPYLKAMRSMRSIRDAYGFDSGLLIVSYFLANAATWRGPVAREIKAELHRRITSLWAEPKDGGTGDA